MAFPPSEILKFGFSVFLLENSCKPLAFSRLRVVNPTHKYGASPLWIGMRGFEHNKINFLQPIVSPGEPASQIWIEQPEKVLNKDQLENTLPSLPPVSSPHWVHSTQPIRQESVVQQLEEMRRKLNVTSHWWIRSWSAKRLGLVVKRGQYPHNLYTKTLLHCHHISQLVNADDVIKVPFHLGGTPCFNKDHFERYQQDLASRQSSSPALYLSSLNIDTLKLKLKPHAQAIEIDMFRSSSATSRQRHYYNISDVKFPKDFSIPQATLDAEATNPSVPINGMTGQQLFEDALVNLPNVNRSVWFTADQLLQEGARCGINAVPVVVEEPRLQKREVFHIDDVETPEIALQAVGKRHPTQQEKIEVPA